MGKCGNDAPIIIEGKKGDTGERGEKGEKGDSITLVNSSVTPEGDTQVNLSDGSSFIVKKGIDGTNGLNGMDGKSITLDRTETDSLGNTTVYLSDGSSFTVQKGDKGDRGANGEKGQDGTSVTIRSTSVADNGDVELHFSDGTIVPIPKGERGADGRDGIDGHDKVQVSDTEPTDPNISIWVKPDGSNCCVVSCAELDNRLDDYYRKHETTSKEELKRLYDYTLVQTDRVKNYDGTDKVDDYRMTMSFNKATGLGIIHLDFMRAFNEVDNVPNGVYSFKLPDNAPKPVNFIEYTDGSVRAYANVEGVIGTEGPNNKRSIINLIGYFDYK